MTDAHVEERAPIDTGAKDYVIPRDPGCTTPGGAGTMPMPVPQGPVGGDPMGSVTQK
jgi:hypothetical protein